MGEFVMGLVPMAKSLPMAQNLLQATQGHISEKSCPEAVHALRVVDIVCAAVKTNQPYYCKGPSFQLSCHVLERFPFAYHFCNAFFVSLPRVAATGCFVVSVVVFLALFPINVFIRRVGPI
jgi:hypothetical protein